ncbi:MAG: hypothetical protein V8S24_00075 [Gordonibacter pamelaeae]
MPSLCVLSALCTVYLSFGIAAVAEHVRLSHLSAPGLMGRPGARLSRHGRRFRDRVRRCRGRSDMVLAAQMTADIAVVYGFIAAFCHKARFPEEGMEGSLGGHTR